MNDEQRKKIIADIPKIRAYMNQSNPGVSELLSDGDIVTLAADLFERGLLEGDGPDVHTSESGEAYRRHLTSSFRN